MPTSKALVLILAALVAAGCVAKGGAAPDALPPAPPTGGANPLAGAVLYVDPDSQAAQRTKQTGGTHGAMLKRIADQPQADWMGEWSGDIEDAVNSRVRAAERVGAVRVMVAYNVPNRDCGQYSGGGVAAPQEYRQWITDFASGIGNGRAVVILEPDALGQLKDCLSDADQQVRLDLLRFAIRTLRQNSTTGVYLDGGNANWLGAQEMAKRLDAAGVREAHGFAVNVSNYVSTERSIAYGKEISQHLGGGVGFVVDTSRNGQGAAPSKEWCNPPGRGLGQAPTTNTGDSLVHALLWIKRPGESDGTCNGGPPAGQWFQEQALELVRNARM